MHRLRLGPCAASVRGVNDTPEPSADASPTDNAVQPSPSNAAERPSADLERIERDLAGVETALQRLDAGTYWTDEATGEPIPDEALAVDPVARRAP